MAREAPPPIQFGGTTIWYEVIRRTGRKSVSVVVDPDAVGTQMHQVATDAAADVQRETQIEPADVPTVRRLDVEETLPTRVAKGLESSRVRIALGVVWRVVAIAHDEDAPAAQSSISTFMYAPTSFVGIARW